MFAIGLILTAVGVGGIIAALVDKKLVWWNASRAEFVFPAAGLILAGVVIMLASFAPRFS